VITRRRLAALLCSCAATAPLGVAAAQSPEQDIRERDNVALAVAKEDGAQEFDFSWSLERQRGTVDNLNAAYAMSDQCSDCKATAIAFQVVIGIRSEVVKPRNRAVAVNNEANRSRAYAFAPQLVVVVNRAARFTGEGRSTLADVRDELRSLEAQDLTLAQLKAAVDAQQARVVKVLTNELVPVTGQRPVRVLDRYERAPADGGG
jgi:hypothetical protein